VRPVSATASTIVGLGLCVSVLEGFDIQAMGVAAPGMNLMRALTGDQKGWVFSASMIGLVAGAMLGGFLADRIGRKLILIVSVLAFGVFSLATIGAESWLPLFAARIATGLGLGGAVPTLIAVAGEASRQGRRTVMTTMMFCGMPVGGAVAALAAQYLVPLADWRVIFVIGGVLPLGVAPLIMWLLPASLPTADAADQPPPSVLVTLFAAERVVATLLLWLAFMLTLICLYILLNWLPLLAVAKGVAKSDAGLASLAYNLGSVPGGVLLGGLVDRFGIRPVMLASFTAATITLAALSVVGGLLPIVVLSALAGWFVVGSLYVLYAITPNYYPKPVRGTGTGAAVGVGRLGSIIGPVVAGLLLGWGISADQVILLMAPAIFIGGVAVLALTWLGRPVVE
jgi:AAHS family 3-hydroxyphenylpropionic acid transporter